MEVKLTLEMIKDSEFYKTRPKSVQKLMMKVPGTHAYEILDTGHLCHIYSYNENGTVTVVRPVEDVDRERLDLADNITHINVFGLKPGDLKIRKDEPVMVNQEDVEGDEVRIVKIQRSLGGNVKETMMLIYDETREFMYEGPITPDVDSFIGDEDKVYAECALTPNLTDGKPNGTYKFSLITPVNDQEW